MPNNYRTLSYANATRRGRTLGIISGVVPIRPTMISGLKLWHAVRLETAYANSDPISTLNDFSGNGNKATQTLTARPTYTTAGGPNSKPFALFDTSNDSMAFDSAISLAKDYTVLIVMANTSGGLVGMVCGSNPTYWGVIATAIYHNTDGTYSTTTTTITGGTFYLLAMRRSLGAYVAYKNGAAVLGSQPGDAAVSLGSYVNFVGGGAVSGIGMNFCECLIYDSNISTNDLSSLFAYLNGIYALY